MTREHYDHYKGQLVKFSIQNIYLPNPTAVLSELHAKQELTGVVLDLSDDARDQEAAFVVVLVKGLDQPCIVPADNVELVDVPEPD
jgi:hypothetical protein